MINKSNDLPSFVNETNLPKIVDKLTDASNIKIANNKYGNRVQTVIDKIVEKADDITKAIKQEVVNDNYSFKVGTGDVDVSADVEDGFGEVGIKGITYQNLVDVSKSYQNLSFVAIKDGSIEFLELEADKTRTIYNDMTLLKPNTKYTIITDCERMCTSNEQNMPIRMNNDGTGYNINVFGLNVEKVGITSMLFTTPSDVSNLKLLFYNNPKNTGFKFKYILILEGDHTNNPNLPSYFEGIVGAGDKSKNLLNPNSFKSSTGISMIENQVINIDVPTDGGQRIIFEGLNLPTGTYRVTTKVLEGEYTGGNLIFYDSNGKKFTENRLIGSYTINATNNNINKLSIWAVKGICKIRIQLEKGFSETPYEPYYDGHKIEILSHGKNLYKPNLQTKSANGLTFSLHGNTLIVNGTCTKYVDFRPVTTTLELYTYVNKLPIGTTLNLSNNLGLKNYFSLKRNGAQTYLTNTLIIQEGDYDIGCFVRFEEGQSYNNAELNIQLEINNVATEFEPYVSDKTQILLDEPLMRLPNGVCDEITRDGKLIRRVGKVDLVDIDEWSRGSVGEKTILFAWHGKYDAIYKCKTSSHGYCDTVVFHKDNSDDRVHCRINGSSPYGSVVFWVDKSQLTTETSEGFKQWLSQNPTTVYYELSTPIITELPAPCLRIFKDGHLTFNTLVAPESNHVVQLNKSGQIQNAIKESQSLDNRINVLENNYDNLMLSTISRLNDLELNYTLK